MVTDEDDPESESESVDSETASRWIAFRNGT